MFRKVFIYVSNLLLLFLSKVVPKRKHIWIFGSWFGQKYSDNPRYLFEYVCKNKPEIRAIWISSNQDVISLLRNKGYEAYGKYSVQAIFLGLRAKYSIFSHSNFSDCMPFLNNERTKLIQLWHGMPFKKIGLDDTKFTTKQQSVIKNRVQKFLFPFADENYDLVCANGELDKLIFERAFQAKRVEITGYARNDALYSSIEKDPGKKTIVTYLPTFREGIGASIDLFSDYGFQLDKWDKTLSALSMKLCIKMHPVNKPKESLVEQFNLSQNIKFIDNEKDAIDILRETDILITDYSSVFFDFLLLERAILFAPFDYEVYLDRDRELYYDYDETIPGDKCENWDQILDKLSSISLGVGSKIDEKILESKAKFFMFDDIKNSERVFIEITKL